MQNLPRRPSTKRRGRPRAFDIDQVTEQALAAFWRQGYEATSVDALVRATGLSVSSIYAAYGSKQGLFRAVVERYQHQLAATLGNLPESDGGLDDVVRFVDRVRGDLGSSRDPAGCLVINTMVELGPRADLIVEIARRYRERIRTGLEHALGRAEQLGQITPGSAESRVAVVQSSIFGALVTARAGALDEADRMFRGLNAEVERWRLTSQRTPSVVSRRATSGLRSRDPSAGALTQDVAQACRTSRI